MLQVRIQQYLQVERVGEGWEDTGVTAGEKPWKAG